jgi:4-hydroxy-tetrahydrodipicolinate synthase
MSYTISGVGTAVVTPFKSDLSVDFKSYRNLVRRQIDNQIDFLVPLGTTGENTCLNDLERCKLIEITMDETNGAIPVFVGAGNNSTFQTIQNIKMFNQFNVDGYLIVTPYYNKPTQSGIFKHFKAVSENTNKKIIIYNVPSRTSVNLMAETTLKTAELKNIIAIKEASSNYVQISEIIKYAPENFNVLSGNDDETLSLCVTGAMGVISVASNLAPKHMSVFWRLISTGEYTKAREYHHKLMPLFKNCFMESNPIPIKAGLNLLNLVDNVLREPLCRSTNKTTSFMKKTILELEINY